MDREKPFPCKVPTCPQSFATEDHLAVHQKNHEMMLNIPGKACFIIDKTPTPSRLIKNLEDVGLFEENIFDVTFRKAIEEKHTPTTPLPTASTSLRRMISIQNEDTLHTPQIPFHMYKEPEEPECVFNANQVKKVDRKIKPKCSNATPSPVKSPTVAKTKTARGQPNKRAIPKLPPRNILPIYKTPAIPIEFPDEIRIQPKWTVMLQYPAYKEVANTTVKDRLRAYLVKNESSQLQTVTLTPPPPTATTVEAPTLNVITPQCNGTERRDDHPPPPVPKKIIPITQSQKQCAAAKRYRNRQKEHISNILRKNDILERENCKLKLENQELHKRLQEALRELKTSS